MSSPRRDSILDATTTCARAVTSRADGTGLATDDRTTADVGEARANGQLRPPPEIRDSAGSSVRRLRARIIGIRWITTLMPFATKLEPKD